MDLFTTYLQVDKNENIADNILEPCKKILSKLPYDDEKYKNGKTSFMNSNSLGGGSSYYKQAFQPLYNLIILNAHRYCQHIRVKRENLKIHIDNIWISEMNKNGSHGMHIHPGNCQLSGTFYVHVEPNSSDIVLCRHECLGDPMNNIQFEEYDNYNSNEWYVPVEKGKLLIWKSDLPHYVISNDSNSRIAISFNLNISQ